MKIILTLVTLLTWSFSSAQFTLEETYDFNLQEREFLIVDLGTSGKKYLSIPQNSDTIYLYNLNHTLFKSINTNINNMCPSGHSNNTPAFGYVTDNLFDSDSDVEYLMTVYCIDTINFSGGISRVFVVNEDENVLFMRDSAYAKYSYKTNEAEIRSIFNTPNGTKMIIYLQSNVWGLSPKAFEVWSLPGTLPMMLEIESGLSEVTISPVPTNGYLTVKYNIEGSGNIGAMSITDVNGVVVKSLLLSELKGVQQLDLSNLPSGSYYISISSGNGQYITKPFILSK